MNIFEIYGVAESGLIVSVMMEVKISEEAIVKAIEWSKKEKVIKIRHV